MRLISHRALLLKLWKNPPALTTFYHPVLRCLIHTFLWYWDQQPSASLFHAENSSGVYEVLLSFILIIYEMVSQKKECFLLVFRRTYEFSRGKNLERFIVISAWYRKGAHTRSVSSAVRDVRLKESPVVLQDVVLDLRCITFRKARRHLASLDYCKNTTVLIFMVVGGSNSFLASCLECLCVTLPHGVFD